MFSAYFKISPKIFDCHTTWIDHLTRDGLRIGVGSIRIDVGIVMQKLSGLHKSTSEQSKLQNPPPFRKSSSRVLGMFVETGILLSPTPPMILISGSLCNLLIPVTWSSSCCVSKYIQYLILVFYWPAYQLGTGISNGKAHQRWLDVWVMFIGFCVTLAVTIPPASTFPNPCVNP